MNFKLNDIKPLIEEALKEKPTGDDWLDARYAEQAPLINHSNPYYKLFYLLAQKLQPQVVVELGGWQGTGAAHFAAGAPEATVITIDHHSDPGDEQINVPRMLDVVNHYPNVNYIRGWTTPGYVEEYDKGIDGWPEVRRILGDDKIDILFIDSWHEGRYFKRDWDYYSPLLANPALVICDDVFDNHIFIDMIKTFEELPGEKFTNGQVHPGIPMGFIKYEVKPTATARKPRKTRRTTKKTA
jgi:predicted O-methyltransferase YrrM